MLGSTRVRVCATRVLESNDVSVEIAVSALSMICSLMLIDMFTGLRESAAPS